MGGNARNSALAIDFVSVVTVSLDPAYYYVRNMCRMSNGSFQAVLSSVKIVGIIRTPLIRSQDGESGTCYKCQRIAHDETCNNNIKELGWCIQV